MSNRLTIQVPDAADLIAGLGAGALIRIQSSATQGGAYANVTTIPIVSTTFVYEYEHLAGLVTDWYKVRFEDSVGSFPKSYSAPFQVNDALTAYASDAAFDTFLRSATIDADAYTRKLALEAAARAIDRCTGRSFHIASTTATARTFSAGQFASPGWPRYAVDVDDFFDATGAIVKFDTTGNGSYTQTVTTYRPMPVDAPAKGMPYRSLLFDIGTVPPIYAFEPSGVQVTALWGWNAIPSAVTLANLIQGARFAKRRDAVFGVAGSPEMGNELRLLAKVDPDVAVMLGEYRLDWGNI